MPHLLKNKNIEVQIDLPKENYNLARFDWTGKIVEVKFNEKSLSGNELPAPAKDQICGKGFFNEFGINAPVGFDETKIGEGFPKIGIGVLRKEEEEYHFHKPHDIQPAEFTVQASSNDIEITCQSPTLNGYSYLLKKEIRLLDSGFKINYHLENHGSKAIITNEYNHNFLCIDKELIGSDYLLKFPFEIKPERFEETVNPESLVIMGNREITFREKPQKPFFFSNLSGGEKVQAKWSLENHHSKIGISETGNFQTNSINLWGWGHVISPELFIPVNIPTRKSMEWSRTYDIYELE